MKQDLQRTQAGRDSLVAYAQLLDMAPTMGNAAELVYATLPPDSPLREVPKAQVCPAFMGEGVALHAIRNGNAADCCHLIYGCARGKVTFFEQCLAAVSANHWRTVELQLTINRLKQVSGGGGPADESTPWMEGTAPPFVLRLMSEASAHMPWQRPHTPLHHRAAPHHTT